MITSIVQRGIPFYSKNKNKIHLSLVGIRMIQLSFILLFMIFLSRVKFEYEPLYESGTKKHINAFNNYKTTFIGKG
jgi:hypothetical protein